MKAKDIKVAMVNCDVQLIVLYVPETKISSLNSALILDAPSEDCKVLYLSQGNSALAYITCQTEQASEITSVLF